MTAMHALRCASMWWATSAAAAAATTRGGCDKVRLLRGWIKAVHAGLCRRIQKASWTPPPCWEAVPGGEQGRRNKPRAGQSAWSAVR
jgi:hypothetical protein